MTKSSVNSGFTQHLPCKCSPIFSWGIGLIATQRKPCSSHLLNYQWNCLKYHQKKYRIINVKKISHNYFNSFFLSCQFKDYKECCQQHGHGEFKTPTYSAERYLHRSSHYICKSFFIRFSGIQIRNRNNSMQFMWS